MSVCAAPRCRKTPLRHWRTSVIQVEDIQVTAIKQGLNLRNQPVTASVIGRTDLERRHVAALKEVSQVVPNFHIPDYGSRMTSSIYIRGLGARIDQPVMGLNIDNIPYLNKDAYDFDLTDIERIEVLRGPQSTLFGRNTMGGVINAIPCRPSPSKECGWAWNTAAATRRNTGFRPTTKTSERVGLLGRTPTIPRPTASSRTSIPVKNATGREAAAAGSRYSTATCTDFVSTTPSRSSSWNRAAILTPMSETGQIAYNDPSDYRRTNFNDGLTIRYEGEKFSVASITSYQYLDDRMNLDQDFPAALLFYTDTGPPGARRDRRPRVPLPRRQSLPLAPRCFRLLPPYQHARTGALQGGRHPQPDPRSFLNRRDSRRMGRRYVPARQPLPHALTTGGASTTNPPYDAGRWRFTAGLRIDFEASKLHYRSYAEATYTTQTPDGTSYPHAILVDQPGTLKQSFTEILPKNIGALPDGQLTA